MRMQAVPVVDADDVAKHVQVCKAWSRFVITLKNSR
jgi:hypothetical protein